MAWCGRRRLRGLMRPAWRAWPSADCRGAAEALSLGAWQRRPELVDRVHRILRRKPAMSPMAARRWWARWGVGWWWGRWSLRAVPAVGGVCAARRGLWPRRMRRRAGRCALYERALLDRMARYARGIPGSGCGGACAGGEAIGRGDGKRNRESLRQLGETNKPQTVNTALCCRRRRCPA